jgi:hypothetical protein
MKLVFLTVFYHRLVFSTGGLKIKPSAYASLLVSISVLCQAILFIGSCMYLLISCRSLQICPDIQTTPCSLCRRLWKLPQEAATWIRLGRRSYGVLRHFFGGLTSLLARWTDFSTVQRLVRMVLRVLQRLLAPSFKIASKSVGSKDRAGQISNTRRSSRQNFVSVTHDWCWNFYSCICADYPHCFLVANKSYTLL